MAERRSPHPHRIHHRDLPREKIEESLAAYVDAEPESSAPLPSGA